MGKGLCFLFLLFQRCNWLFCHVWPSLSSITLLFLSLAHCHCGWCTVFWHHNKFNNSSCDVFATEILGWNIIVFIAAWCGTCNEPWNRCKDFLEWNKKKKEMCLSFLPLKFSLAHHFVTFVYYSFLFQDIVLITWLLHNKHLHCNNHNIYWNLSKTIRVSIYKFQLVLYPS